MLLEQNLPEGFAWNIAPGSQLDTILTDLEEQELQSILQRATDCGTVRNPFLCADYNALADEFGAELWNGVQDIEEYRSYLSTFVYTPYRTASDSDIQSVLQKAGFIDAVVVKNNKAQDLRQLILSSPIMVAGLSTAVAGNDLAVSGYRGYELLVNGDLKSDSGSNIGYQIGNDSGFWGYVDIICGGVSYDVNGNIDTITELQVSEAYESIFKRLLLRTKPLHNWLILAVEFVTDGVIAQTGNEEDPILAQTGSEIIDIIAQQGV